MFKQFMQSVRAVRLLALCWAVLAFAVLPAQADEFLPPEKAFRFSARMVDPGHAELTWRIADGYYMYRDRFAFKAEGARLGQPSIPAGKVKYDETFQKDVETHRGTVAVIVPVEAQGPFTLIATSQGCADQGLCYPPMDQRVSLTPTAGGAMQTAAGALAPDAEMGRIEASLQSGRLLTILPLFLLLGIGLSFTPCVLPMVPILSSIIVGEGAQSSRSRGLLLSASYSLGMALVYTVLGIAAGLVGEGLAAALQSPSVLGAFALLMALLSLSMFGVYQLQVPAALQSRLTQVSGRFSGGKLAGVFVMGALSALIVGPCVAAPLAGALLYISQTRDVVIGGSALFAMAAGMSVPLLLVGVSAGALLPRAGAWMASVKVFFGVLMLALALWIVTPVLPGWIIMLGWGMLAAGYGVRLLFSPRFGWRARAAGLLFAAAGAVQLAGAATGGLDPLAPLAHLREGGAHTTAFRRVASIAELDAAIAGAAGKTVMLDFYADWCVSCKEMEKLTFTDARVKAHFDEMVLLQADVTANNEDDKALLRRFNLFGPPGIIFYDKQGREIPGGRVIGYQDADKFSQVLELVRQF
ncbi:thiol:disulfide interchange protein DsbD [Noviherbaspirillum aridicola]|uniref:Thiol:disulfide interchange protein DsbD n=2 Tax=Noviherbaspirillum aridicola TaxID=2849687 RepID=A0ABQ4Q9F3_9BURK|nr:protein-disulfide reductase DsbD [Noviherbaspirillum aridicola]GIZ53410.1 thiol:disulfide interchange protein DsbD [Noviherbaspirillum aridicola]